jgi:hypothetical protein
MQASRGGSETAITVKTITAKLPVTCDRVKYDGTEQEK